MDEYTKGEEMEEGDEQQAGWPESCQKRQNKQVSNTFQMKKNGGLIIKNCRYYFIVIITVTIFFIRFELNQTSCSKESKADAKFCIGFLFSSWFHQM